MQQFRNNTFRVVGILLMLSTAPLGVSYSYAEIEENTEYEEIPYDPRLEEYTQFDEIQVILVEKVIDGKLEEMEFILPKDTVEEDFERILSLEGTSSWSYVTYKTYNSGIVLFDGKVSKLGQQFWKITLSGTLNLSKGELNLDFSGKSNNSTNKTSQNSSEDLDYRVVFSGNLDESDEENVFAIASMNSSQVSETVKNFKFLQFGNLTSENEKNSGWDQYMRNPGLVI